MASNGAKPKRLRKERKSRPPWPQIQSEEQRGRVLDATRQDITDITVKILEDLKTRLDYVKDIAVVKGTDTPVRDPKREEAVLNMVREWCRKNRQAPEVCEEYYLPIIRQVMASSRSIQTLMRIRSKTRENLLGDWIEAQNEEK